uniref:Tudor domain-containing protein n=1 Tax=Romanomermis culicivorax TaxID=13658 RepID=A0A915L7K0_ROMCU
MVPPSRINNSISDEQNEQRTTATNSEIDYVPQFDRLSNKTNVKVVQSTERHVPASIFGAVVWAPASSALDHFGTSRFVASHYGESCFGAKSFTDFGIAQGDIYVKLFPELQLIKDEELQVLVSHFEDNGDLYVQMSRMEQAFCDLEIDMNSFYNNPFQNETYIMKDEMMRVGIPVAVCSGQSWRRARIVNIRGDSVFVQQVDFGSTIEVRKQDIRYLKSTFVTNAVAPCAILCSLYNVQHDFRDRDSVNSFIQEFLSDAARIIATVVDKRPIDNVPFIKLDVYSYDLNAPVNLNQEIDRRYTFDHAPSKRNSTPQTLMNDLNADLACWTTSAAQDIKNSNYFTESESSSV